MLGSIVAGWEERKGTVAKLKSLLRYVEFDEAVGLVFLEGFVWYRLLLVGLIEVTVAYERGDGGLLMDLKILRSSVLSMSSLLPPTLFATMIRYPFRITAEAAHIGIWRIANVTL